MKKAIVIWLAVFLLACAAGCTAAQNDVSGAASSSSVAASASESNSASVAVSASEASSAGAASSGQPPARERADSKPEQKSAKDEHVSPIPDKDAFLKAHNLAAEKLGGSLIDPEKIEALSWGESGAIEGGFMYDGYSNGYSSGVVMFEPEYIRITGRISDEEQSLKEYASVAAGVTGGDPQAALDAMRDLLKNVEPDTWTNGYEVNLGEVEFEGVSFTIEIGKQDGMVQFWVNPDGLGASLKKNGT